MHRQKRVSTEVVGTIVAALVAVALPSARGGMIDGSIFFDDFDGNQVVMNSNPAWVEVDMIAGGAATNWSGVAFSDASQPRITVANSLLTLYDTYQAYCFMNGKPASFAALGSKTVWAAEVRFQVASGRLHNDYDNRDFRLLSGFSSADAASGVDFRLKKDGSGEYGATFSLAWWGHDSTDDNRISAVIGTLNKGSYYTVSALRKSDNNVDIYLDGSLIATKPVLNPGVNPVKFSLGHGGAYGVATVTYDYVKLGLFIPPQGTVVLIR